MYDAETETQRENDEKEVEEEIMINQNNRLFVFNRVNGSITQYSERSSPTEDVNQSQNNTQKCKSVQTENSIQTFSPLNSIKPSKRSKDITPLIPTMDKVNSIDMNFIFKKRGHSPGTDRLRQEKNRILKPNKTRIVGYKATRVSAFTKGENKLK